MDDLASCDENIEIRLTTFEGVCFAIRMLLGERERTLVRQKSLIDLGIASLLHNGGEQHYTATQLSHQKSFLWLHPWSMFPESCS